MPRGRKYSLFPVVGVILLIVLIALSGAVHTAIHDKAQNIGLCILELFHTSGQNRARAIIFTNNHDQTVSDPGRTDGIHNGPHRRQIDDDILIHGGDYLDKFLKPAGIQQLRRIFRNSAGGNQVEVGAIRAALVTNYRVFHVLCSVQDLTQTR